MGPRNYPSRRSDELLRLPAMLRARIRAAVRVALPAPCRGAILGEHTDFREETNGRRTGRHSDVVSRLLEVCPEKRSEAFLVEAPLRICPLGAHVDHQGGVVTGMTIDRAVVLAAAPAIDPMVRISSLDFSGDVVLDLRENGPAKVGDWGDYRGRLFPSSNCNIH